MAFIQTWLLFEDVTLSILCALVVILTSPLSKFFVTFGEVKFPNFGLILWP